MPVVVVVVELVLCLELEIVAVVRYHVGWFLIGMPGCQGRALAGPVCLHIACTKVVSNAVYTGEFSGIVCDLIKQTDGIRDCREFQ